MRYETVVFDLDGTLIDSVDMILASLKHATRTVLGREIPETELRKGIGRTLVAHMREIDIDRAEELIRVYSDHNTTLHSDLRPFEGIVDVLTALAEGGRRLAVATAKRRETVELAFGLMPELAAPFELVVAAEDTERHKPHPDPILHALERLRADAAASAYVGDSPVDVQAAKAAGVASVAVTWGRLHARERLAQEDPDFVVDAPEELLGIL